MRRAHLLPLALLAAAACDDARTTRPGPTSRPPASPRCGNATLEPGEVCDGAELGAKRCVDLGLEAGTLRCAASCLDFDRSGCGAPPTCGNGVIDDAERCDGTNLAGQTCLNVGLGDGQLGCKANCADLDTSGCAGAAACGNGRLDPGEQCDPGIGSGAGACPSTCPAPVGCMATNLVGSGCEARCEAVVISTPADGDGCCPAGADAMTDDDCDASCGDHTCDGHESCTSCATDCGACCGNGQLESGEACDTGISAGAGACPSAASCIAPDTCTTATLSGMDCAASCDLAPITARVDGDTCCPSGATRADDDDCPVACDDGICDASEDCASCPTDCACGTSESCVSAMCVDACGDGTIGVNEVCEPSDLDNQSCMSRGFSGGSLACAADCTMFDESGCSNAPAVIAGPTLLIPGSVASWIKSSATGDHVAALVGYSSTTGRGTLVLASTTGGPVVTLGNNVAPIYKFSEDGAWIAYVDDHSNSSNQGTEQLWLVPTGGGQAVEVGRRLDISGDFEFTADSRYLLFVDEYSFNASAGRLQMRSLQFGTTTTVDTGVHDLHVSPRSDAFAYSTAYSRTTNRASLKLARLPGLQTRTIGTNIAANFAYDYCVQYVPDGSFLVFVDDVAPNATQGTLRSLSSPSGFPATLANNVETTQGCFKASSDGIRLVYKTSYDSNNRSAAAYWVSTAGGPSTFLGSTVGWIRVSLYGDSNYVAFVDDYVYGFNADYGTFKYFVAGSATPVTAASNVFGRYRSGTGSAMTSFASAFDFGLERGQLHALDMSTGQSTMLASNAYEWIEYAPDASRGLFVANYDNVTDTGRLEIADLPSGANKRVVAATGYNYRMGFTSDGANIYYMINYDSGSGAGDFMFEPAAGGTAVTVAAGVKPVSSPYFNPSGRYFTLMASPNGSSRYYGVLRAVSGTSGEAVEVDAWADDARWLGDSNRLWFSKPNGGGLWIATIGP